MRTAPLVLLLLTLAPACSNERRTKHEALAKTLERPVSLLCEADNPDRGGKAAREAAEALIAIPQVSDVETENMLAAVRKSARALVGALGDACKDEDAARCAEARKNASFNVGDLKSAVTRLGSNAELRTGAKMPVPTPEGCATLRSAASR